LIGGRSIRKTVVNAVVTYRLAANLNFTRITIKRRNAGEGCFAATAIEDSGFLAIRSKGFNTQSGTCGAFSERVGIGQ
jgi:hypothetical protein